MILELEINKSNTSLLASNSKLCYIIGIGKTNYTIHKDADDIKKAYNCNNFYRNFRKYVDYHNYHVFLADLKNILDYIKLREIISYKGFLYKIVNFDIGVQGETLVKLKRDRTFGDKLISEGPVELKHQNRKLRYIVELEQIK